MQSEKKDSGKPADLPSQSRLVFPERVLSGVDKLVGPAGMGVLEPGVLIPPEA